MPTEQDLFHQIKCSDKQAFEVLFRLYYQPLKHYAYKFTQDTDIAQGIAQETFAQVWEKRHKLESSSPKAYLYKAVKNRALNHLRHQVVKAKYEKEITNTQYEWEEEDFDHSDKISKVLLAVNQLPNQCKNIFLMSRMNGLKHTEIAEELNISIKTVKNQIGKALKTLRQELKGIDITAIICILKLFLEKN
ncbi:RNA polymerase sigma-70 factor [Labilibacter marinus]|uniref:RNA polymerase sigma-70 factor n=1 Tax=Labilibacter marinus TaxID=1477105 RepID=UPI00082FD847|nr:RNA polymerase sigma-70 factor [Labilibacter marinus]